jgi:hypothetical protein
MAITSQLARQTLMDRGFQELQLTGGGSGSTFRHHELPAPWSITAQLDTGDLLQHVDVSLQFRDQQIGVIHRVTTHATLATELPGIVSSLMALVGSAALTCPRCGSGWVTVREADGAQPAFLACADNCEPGPVLSHVQPIVTY